MQFEYDPERLIEEVKKRPGIWDYLDTNYRAKNMRCKLWSEVVTELLHPNVKVSKSEMRELEIQLQKKWKSIRDCFQKYTINPTRTKRPYIYHRQLQFLLKDQEQPQKEDGNANSDSDDERPKKRRKVWRHKFKKLTLTKDEETSEEDNSYDDTVEDSKEFISIDIGETHIQPHAKPQINKSPVSDEFVFASVDAQPKVESEDPDKMFLLSLLPHFKSIPEELRLNVKMELMQVLRNANYASLRNHKIL